MNDFVLINLEQEENKRCWMIVKTTFYTDYKNKIGKVGIAMARDIFGDMRLEPEETLLENELYTEEEAEVKCIEWAKKTGLDFLNKVESRGQVH